MDSNNPLRRIRAESNPSSHEKIEQWWLRAACLHQPEKMFPQRKKDLSYISEARRICRSCPVKSECREYALTFPHTDLHGVWGGLTPRQLAAEQKRRDLSPSKPTLAQLWSSFAGKKT